MNNLNPRRKANRVGFLCETKLSLTSFTWEKGWGGRLRGGGGAGIDLTKAGKRDTNQKMPCG